MTFVNRTGSAATFATRVGGTVAFENETVGAGVSFENRADDAYVRQLGDMTETEVIAVAGGVPPDFATPIPQPGGVSTPFGDLTFESPIDAREAAFTNRDGGSGGWTNNETP